MTDTNPHLYALIACEPSADILGAGLMQAILRKDPKASFIGIGGPQMIHYGMRSLYPMDVLSVMGIAEVVSHLVPIIKIRTKITKNLLNARPCVMIGIDAPDFNLHVEGILKKAGIPTIHYVSPSVWAWRQGRIKKIKASCDEVLALLPFEKEFYDKEGMRCTYVGHTLANRIPFEISKEEARNRILLQERSVEPIEGKVLAILPGSRSTELKHMVPVFAACARLVKAQMPEVVFISVSPTHEKALLLKDLWLEYAPDIRLSVFVGMSHDVIASADVALLASGTVAFEAMLLKKPMVVAYKVNPLTAFVGRRMLKVNMYSLPNLLAKRRIVSEFIQENCTPNLLCEEVCKLLKSDNLLMKKEFMTIHKNIRMNSDEIASDAVFKLIKDKKEEIVKDPVETETKKTKEDVNEAK